ncbi:MAG: TraB/GumN family protein [Candidatus Scalindua rubra]|uniref:TraB family protein n=1 Tax=Candidatus Scalindua brodae TaxID=237368 RepID=A0A0B0EFE1_9BACT|nr:MAG: TraB family protein [Candidatus Scalindua brodae]MBZ0109489.1 TraB/GumN family protein [Candidatus Scalindua rubra]TWU36950.1 TraB family protein [Candidatus Brocadiaceae bacterium S225]
MKKLIIVFIAIVLFSTAVSAESSVWELDTDNGGFYLAGSCHVLRKSDYPLPEEFESAYEDVDQVIFETDIEALMSQELQLLLISKGMYTEGDTLEKKLSKKSYASLLKYCNDRSMSIELFQNFKPWMVTMTLLLLELEKNAISPADGLDMYFSNKANKDGKQTGGLEDVYRHIELVSSFDEEFDESIVESFIREAGELQVMMEDLIKSWRAGDESGIDEYLTVNMRTEFPKLYKRLLTDRNRDWIPRLETLINSGKRTLVIVGVGHLIGENSVIDLLKFRGHKVKKFKG